MSMDKGTREGGASAEIADPEIRAFIARTTTFWPEEGGVLGVAEQRRSYDNMCAAFRRPRPAGLAVRDEALPGPAGPVPARRYRPAAGAEARVVYYHGGGFILGGLESHDDICAELAAGAGCEVVAVDYRLAPEHPHPAAFEDALAAARAVLAEGPVVLAGDSAGGNLAASVAAELRGEALRGQVLIYPGLGGERLGLASYRECAAAPMLTAAEVARYRRLRAGGEPPGDDPRFDPLLRSDLGGLAPTFVSAAGVDPLRDDGPDYVRRLRAAGVEGLCVVEEGLPHGHLRARHMARRAAAAFARIVAVTARLARGEGVWPIS